MENLRQAADKKTGPTSAAGKSRCSRNAVKHGHFSKVPIYPRKPDKYPECENCQDKAECEADKSGYCHRKIETYNRFFLAIQNGDPAYIESIIARNFADVQSLIAYLLNDIHKLGTLIDSPVLGSNDKGATIVMPKLIEWKANPSVSRLIDLFARLGITLPQFGITPQSANDAKLLEGHLADEDEKKQTATEARKQFFDKMDSIKDAIDISKKSREQDQALQDYRAEEEAAETEEHGEEADDK